MTLDVSLRPLDEGALETLLAVAVADADPEEVMPPVPGPPGWTASRIAVFREFYRERLPGLDGPLHTVMYAIMTDGEVIGMIRLTRTGYPGFVETGMWLARSARGMGAASSALRKVIAEAATAGAHTIVAETTAGNLGAIRALLGCGARLEYEGDVPGIADGSLVGTSDATVKVRALIAVPPRAEHARSKGGPCLT